LGRRSGGTLLDGGERRKNRQLRVAFGAFQSPVGDGVGDTFQSDFVLAVGAFQECGDERDAGEGFGRLVRPRACDSQPFAAQQIGVLPA
jgi:hypothetical protein